jgi:hypothetical protein
MKAKKPRKDFVVSVKGNFNYMDVREMFCDFTLTEVP